MPKKLVDCVKKVKASGSADNPYAVCVASTGLHFEKKKGQHRACSSVEEHQAMRRKHVDTMYGK